MDQQNRTTESDKSSKRTRGKLDDFINRLDSDTIQKLLSVLKEYSNVEIIDSLNERLKNPQKRIIITQPAQPQQIQHVAYRSTPNMGQQQHIVYQTPLRLQTTELSNQALQQRILQQHPQQQPSPMLRQAQQPMQTRLATTRVIVVPKTHQQATPPPQPRPKQHSSTPSSAKGQSPDTDTFQSLISVLKEHRTVETIELLNKILENRAKRPNLDSSATSDPILNDLKSSLTNISSRLTGMELKMSIPVVDEKPIVLNDGQAVSKAIFEAVGKHILTTQPRFDLDSVIPRCTRLMLVVLRGGRHESSKLFLCPSQKKIGDLLQHFQIHDEVSPETIHVLTAVPCESIDWICFIDLPGEIIMLDKPTTTS